MSTDVPNWSSDVPISMPQPPANRILVPMFGFGMTELGLAHDLTDGEYEFLKTPSYAPDLPADNVVFDDDELG